METISCGCCHGFCCCCCWWTVKAVIWYLFASIQTTVQSSLCPLICSAPARCLYIQHTYILFNVNAIILLPHTHTNKTKGRKKRSSCCRAIQFMSLVDCFHNRNQMLNRISMFWSKRKTLYKYYTKVAVRKSTSYHFFVFDFVFILLLCTRAHYHSPYPYPYLFPVRFPLGSADLV